MKNSLEVLNNLNKEKLNFEIKSKLIIEKHNPGTELLENICGT